MSFFLNKHDFLKVTAADIAQIYLEYLKTQQEFNCWVVAFWFDKKRKTIFCLIDAPDLESVKEIQQLYHSFSNEIIQVEENRIKNFFRNITNPKPLAGKNISQSLVFPESELSTVMAIKVYCSSKFLTRELTKRKRLIEEFQVCSHKLVKKNEGRILKSTCDGCIYTFGSVSQSIKSALQIQQELNVQNETTGGIIVVGIGIDGKRLINGQYISFEESTNLAQRLCCIAGNNQIMVSSIVEQQFQLEELWPLVENRNWKSLNCKDEQFLIRLMDIIEQNYREDLKISDFCKIMGESRSQLYRKIIEITNLPPIELINEFRLKKATELMNTQNGSNISQIAFEAGFNSLSYFSRRFKKRYGLLPSAYTNSMS